MTPPTPNENKSKTRIQTVAPTTPRLWILIVLLFHRKRQNEFPKTSSCSLLREGNTHLGEEENSPAYARVAHPFKLQPYHLKT